MSEINSGPLTNSYTFSVSREMLLDMGRIEPTPEELARRNAESEAFHGAQRDRRSAMLAAVKSLRDKDELTDRLLDLHSTDFDDDWSHECHGCDFSGHEGEPPAWPCRTVDLLMERHGIEWPTGPLPGKHYEGEFVPSDGRVIDWGAIHRSMWHAFSDTLGDTP